MKTYGEIPRLGHVNSLSTRDSEMLKKMIEYTQPGNNELADSIFQTITAQYTASMKVFNEALDAETRAVLKRAQKEGIITGRISKKKVTEAGYDVCYQEEVGAYIRRNGVRVSEIIKHPAV